MQIVGEWQFFGSVLFASLVQATEQCPRALLGQAVIDDESPGLLLRREISAAAFPQLDGHAVRASTGRRVIVPGAGLLSIMFEALAASSPDQALFSQEITSFKVRKPLVLTGTEGSALRITVITSLNGENLKIISGDKLQHATALRKKKVEMPAFSPMPESAKSSLEPYSVDHIYSVSGTKGLAYESPYLHVLTSASVHDNYAIGTVELAPSVDAAKYRMDETLLDGFFHLLAGIFLKANRDPGGQIAVPGMFQSVHLNPAALADAPRKLRCEVHAKEIPTLASKLFIFDLLLSRPDDGTPVLIMQNGAAARKDPANFGD